MQTPDSQQLAAEVAWADEIEASRGGPSAAVASAAATATSAAVLAAAATATGAADDDDATGAENVHASASSDAASSDMSPAV